MEASTPASRAKRAASPRLSVNSFTATVAPVVRSRARYTRPMPPLAAKERSSNRSPTVVPASSSGGDSLGGWRSTRGLEPRRHEGTRAGKTPGRASERRIGACGQRVLWNARSVEDFVDSAITRVPVVKVVGGAATAAIDAIATEEPLELRLSGGDGHLSEP